ncbi:hypothetical protein GCM10022225_37530 [Plantactinospora mayteni]|uniref:Uncharacterized protein n=1 Tax=Plantactinospora mayteni TaxID=566021 RepID=A0ABQ4EKQ2_9ACTN|nr:hypothetical protein [Plantactinospora mayteni]GIG95333.1 hypothetical protein Pma05_19060 [Plantactinospora mayteni]
MTNVQQPEMRRNELNPTVQESKRPRPGDPTRVRGGAGRRIPPEQVSPYGPSARPVAEDPDRNAAGRSGARRVESS